MYSRECRDDGDFERMRRLLIEAYSLNGRFHSWWLERIDGNRYHRPVKGKTTEWRTGVQLWFTDDDKLVGVVNPDGAGTAAIQIHPRHRRFEPEMVDWAEMNLAHRDGDAAKLSTWVFDYDECREKLLKSRGYEMTGKFGYTRRRSLEEPVPEVELPEGYALRTLTDEDDALMADTLNLVFGRDIHTAEAYRNQRTAPTYRGDLDYGLFTRDGTLAAFTTVWYHPENRIGVFEPVGTHPMHRRKGLATQLMFHGMKRLAEFGADYVYVGTGSREAPNRLYESIGFTEADRSREWSRALV
ncbi:GNAT family N-acetyltransferase [Candidatus Bathyarchaeota archaeon]|nr:GNAT family N-acetyltransferase [Candidatus Bathyarchaeota archaeon]